METKMQRDILLFTKCIFLNECKNAFTLFVERKIYYNICFSAIRGDDSDHEITSYVVIKIFEFCMVSAKEIIVLKKISKTMKLTKNILAHEKKREMIVFTSSCAMMN